MVISIDGNLITKLPDSLKNFYDDNPSLKEKALSFQSQNVTDIGPNSILYVRQGEFAIVPSNEEKIKFFGSDEATTCHIIILKHPSGTCAAAHLDGREGEPYAIDKIFKEFASIEGPLEMVDVFVIGGYDAPAGSKAAEKNESESLSLKLLDIFFKCPFRINLSLWCTCTVNTLRLKNGPFPALYGIALDRTSNRVIPASFSNLAYCFQLNSALHFVQTSDIPQNFYDHKEKVFNVVLPPEWNTEPFKYYAHLPDDLILRYFSTSPEVEPEKVPRNWKKAFALLASNSPKTLFKNGVGRKFNLNEDGIWEEIF